MLKVANMMQNYEFREDINTLANALLADMQRFNARNGGLDEADLVERRALETLVVRLISEARIAEHPLTTSPQGFWPTWMGFVNNTAMMEQLQSKRSPFPVRSTSHTRWITEDPFASEGPDTATGPNLDVVQTQNSAAHAGVIDASSTISQVRRAFLQQRLITDGDGRAEESIGLILQFLVDFLGDRPLGSLTASDFLRVENALPEIPHPRGVPKEYQASLHTRWLYAQSAGWEGLTPISKVRLRNAWHGGLHAFFKWARAKAAYDGPNYEFRLVSRKNRAEIPRDAWKPEEILKLFSLPLFVGCKSAAHFWQPGTVFVQNHIYWAYLLIFFTGMRPSEIGKLRLDQVIEIEGVWYLDFRNESGQTAATTVKSVAGKRLIPIPALIIDLGFLDRVEVLRKKGETKVFPEWKLYTHKVSGREMWGHDFSKSWQYVKVKFSFERPQLTLYGGRHTRATWYDQASIPQRVRNRLLGHASTNIADGYGAIHITPEEAKLVLSKINSVEIAVAEILIEAKLRADYGLLETSSIV
ncbi:tyrosine-type recombinase/integrase [Pelagibacterium sp.]|uniref:tyrosine-type recombinase/integrase n=1 Tax=Pelagibacterium sp. TaxID=1967288 RepID=UPI003A9494FE